MVLNGQKVVAWGVKSIEKHLPSESAEAGSQGDARAAALNDLLSEVGVRRARVVTDLPLFDSLMRQLEVPEMNRRYLASMVTSEVLETIPLFEAEADFSWRIHPNGGNQEVFAAAVPRGAMDNHVQLLRAAGIRPAVAYSRAVALACAANVPDAIMIHLEGTHVSIVVVHDGVPQSLIRWSSRQQSLAPRRRRTRFQRRWSRRPGTTRPSTKVETGDGCRWC